EFEAGVAAPSVSARAFPDLRDGCRGRTRQGHAVAAALHVAERALRTFHRGYERRCRGWRQHNKHDEGGEGGDRAHGPLQRLCDNFLRGRAMRRKNRSHHCIKAVTKLALLSVSYLALAAASASEVRARASPPAEQGTRQSDEPPSPPGAPAQEAPSGSSPGTPAPEAPAAQPDASPSPVTPAQQQPNVPP